MICPFNKFWTYVPSSIIFIFALISPVNPKSFCCNLFLFSLNMSDKIFCGFCFLSSPKNCCKFCFFGKNWELAPAKPNCSWDLMIGSLLSSCPLQKMLVLCLCFLVWRCLQSPTNCKSKLIEIMHKLKVPNTL